MYIRNDLHMKLHAEDHIRARLKEAENYHMLNQLRKHRQSVILRPIRLFFGQLGRALISAGERLESYEVSLVS